MNKAVFLAASLGLIAFIYKKQKDEDEESEYFTEFPVLTTNPDFTRQLQLPSPLPLSPIQVMPKKLDLSKYEFLNEMLASKAGFANQWIVLEKMIN